MPGKTRTKKDKRRYLHQSKKGEVSRGAAWVPITFLLSPNPQLEQFPIGGVSEAQLTVYAFPCQLYRP